MFNAASAIQYNLACQYPANIIAIIQKAVMTGVTWTWDEKTVTAVAAWQKGAKLDPDGMVGPKSLAKMIEELKQCGKSGDADALKAYWDKVKSEAATTKNASELVSEFVRVTTHPFKFEKFKDRHPATQQMVDFWTARGTFEVRLKLKKSLSRVERLKYEYRQYIAGDAWVEPGSWNAAKSIWTSSGPRKSINQTFEIPRDATNATVGLTRTFKEDGLDRPISGRAFRFGYRGDFEYDEPRFKNKWTPDEDGHDFVLRDSPGYGEPFDGSAPKIHMEFRFRGDLVEVDRFELPDGTSGSRVKRVISSLSWDYRFEDTLRWWRL